MKRTATPSRSRVVWIGVFAVVIAITMANLPRPHAGANQHTGTAAGMRAYIDPETGQLGTPASLPPLSIEEKALLEPAQTPREVVLPDGSVMLELNGTGQEFTVMHLDAAGNRTVQCVQTAPTAVASTAPVGAAGGR